MQGQIGGCNRPEERDRDESEELSPSAESDMHSRSITPFAHLKTRAGALCELLGGFLAKTMRARRELASSTKRVRQKNMDDSYRVHLKLHFTV